MKHLIIINGKPRSGKDTFSKYVLDYITGNQYSSIDMVIKAAKYAGYDYENDTVKSDKDRNFLSELKMLFDKYYQTSFNYILNLVTELNKGEAAIYHVREVENIEVLRNYYKDSDEVKVTTVYVDNDNITHIPNNTGDLSTLLEYEYDFTINNDGTLVDLKDKAEMFVNKII